jgi:hypothetical protein
VTLTGWKPSQVSVPSSMSSVFCCAAVSSALCWAPAWIFYRARTQTCRWLPGLAEKEG